MPAASKIRLKFFVIVAVATVPLLGDRWPSELHGPLLVLVQDIRQMTSSRLAVLL
jgi:hypothetical protein